MTEDEQDRRTQNGEAWPQPFGETRLNNAAKQQLLDKHIAVGHRNWTFCDSDSDGHRAAIMFALIESARLPGVAPKAWLADVLTGIADHPAQRLDALLPRNWTVAREREAVRQAA